MSNLSTFINLSYFVIINLSSRCIWFLKGFRSLGKDFLSISNSRYIFIELHPLSSSTITPPHIKLSRQFFSVRITRTRSPERAANVFNSTYDPSFYCSLALLILTALVLRALTPSETSFSDIYIQIIFLLNLSVHYTAGKKLFSTILCLPVL